jgi:hypothetical protein
VPQEPAGRQKRHAEQTNPFAPEGNHHEYSPLRYAFQFNDWKMFATGYEADLDPKLVAVTTMPGCLRSSA